MVTITVFEAFDLELGKCHVFQFRRFDAESSDENDYIRDNASSYKNKFLLFLIRLGSSKHVPCLRLRGETLTVILFIY